MPSDYMVTTMRKLDMLEKLDLAKIPNAKYISADLRKLPFDPTGEYTLPYTTGITGIIYNKKYVKETPASLKVSPTFFPIIPFCLGYFARSTITVVSFFVS